MPITLQTTSDSITERDLVYYKEEFITSGLEDYQDSLDIEDLTFNGEPTKFRCRPLNNKQWKHCRRYATKVADKAGEEGVSESVFTMALFEKAFDYGCISITGVKDVEGKLPKHQWQLLPDEVIINVGAQIVGLSTIMKTIPVDRKDDVKK